MSTPLPSLPRATGARIGGQTLRLPFDLSWTSLALGAIVLLAAGLRFANLDAIGQSNTYYTAAVESMLQSWHNFFFVAAEPGGAVSIDKPPVGLWLQTISAYFLGVNGFAVVLPQLLAGIGSVVLLFHLVRRSFGNVAGLLAALALAVTPVAIAVERNNTPDATLILTLLLAAWAFILATERGKLRWLILGAVLVGVGFNIKMMQAFLPLPALYALYFFGARQSWGRKILNLALTTLVLLPVALSWAIVVDLTPADQRPYVGSSENNSALNLIIGYNGVQRLLGNGMGGVRPGAPAPPDGAAQTTPPTDGARPDDGGMGGPAGAGGAFGTGAAGPLRLFQSGLAAQVSWLLPFGLILLVAMAVSIGWMRPQTALHHGLILWGGWLLTCVAFFSVAGFFHQYYLAMLGPPLAALVGIGATFVWGLRATHPIRAALLLLTAAAVTLAFQVYAVWMYGALAWWIAAPIVLALLGLSLLLISLRRSGWLLARASFAVLIAALLTTPSIWSGLTTAYATQSLPEAYAGARRSFGMGGRMMPAPMDDAAGAQPPAAGMGGDMDQGVNQALLSYLEANTQDVKYLMVVPSSQAGADYVLATGRPVLYAGGFGGGDPVIDGDSLAALAANGDVRYVLWGGGGPGGRGSSSSITSYLQSSCTVVSDASLGTATSATPTDNADGRRGFDGGRGGQSTLYQCGG